MNYRQSSPDIEQTEPVDFSSGGISHAVNVKVDSSAIMQSPNTHSPGSLSQHSSSFMPMSPNAGNNHYQLIRSPSSETSNVRSYNMSQDEYSDCEREPPYKMMRGNDSLRNSRIRDGRELLQCPTPGCDGILLLLFSLNQN